MNSEDESKPRGVSWYIYPAVTRDCPLTSSKTPTGAF
jgi:hypothetical protein